MYTIGDPKSPLISPVAELTQMRRHLIWELLEQKLRKSVDIANEHIVTQLGTRERME
jgi:hypothetical protein